MRLDETVTEVEGENGMLLHDPAVPCCKCGRLTLVSTRETRSKRRIYCSPNCKQQEWARRNPCPRPDKRRYPNEESAKRAFSGMGRVADWNVYECRCGYWHGGRLTGAPHETTAQPHGPDRAPETDRSET